jgi:RND family efflux transporter MFP subunit
MNTRKPASVDGGPKAAVIFLARVLTKRQRATKCIALISLPLVPLIAGCSAPASETRPVAVHVQTLSAEEVGTALRYSATVKERQRVQISFKVPGTVEKVLQIATVGAASRAAPAAPSTVAQPVRLGSPDLPSGGTRDVQEGDVVSRGAALATLEAADYRRDRDAAAERLSQATAQVESLRAQLLAAKQNLWRLGELASARLISQQVLDEATATFSSLTAQVSQAQHQAGEAKIALAQAEDNLRHCTLVSPWELATVAARSIEANQRVAANQPAFVLVDVSTLLVAFGVADTLVGQLWLGQAVSIQADALPGRSFAGTIHKIAPTADERTRTYLVEVEIRQPGDLRPGMVASIQLRKSQTAHLLPLAAVQRGASPQDCVVYEVVEEGGRRLARRRRVECDGIADNRVRIKTGGGTEIQERSQIVVAGASRLRDGDRVNVLNDE